MWAAVKAIFGFKAILISAAIIAIVATLWGIFYVVSKSTLLWHSENSVILQQEAIENVTKFEAKRRKQEHKQKTDREELLKEALEKDDANKPLPESIRHFWNGAWNI